MQTWRSPGRQGCGDAESEAPRWNEVSEETTEGRGEKWAAKAKETPSSKGLEGPQSSQE